MCPKRSPSCFSLLFRRRQTELTFAPHSSSSPSLSLLPTPASCSSPPPYRSFRPLIPAPNSSPPARRKIQSCLLARATCPPPRQRSSPPGEGGISSRPARRGAAATRLLIPEREGTEGEERARMSCFSCFGPALEAEDGKKKPVPAADKDSQRKDGSAPRGGGGSDKLRPNGGLDSKKDHLTIPRDGSSQNIAAQIFTFRELAAATKNFKQDSLLGEGGFGRVYKGRLDNGQAVAVKQLDRNGLQGNREFLVEVLMLSLLHHTNLVNLIGYCADGDQRLLVYEFMPLGSLEDHLHDVPPEKEPLDWNTRMKIAAGAAKGLEHLHDKASPPVIYRDFKSSNILLGEGFHPKLSDFGLAKLGPVGDKTHVSTRVMGTYGYCAPEYAMTGQLTVKSDVYSFGVVFLELITGRKAIDNTKPQREQNLVAWARPLFKDRRKFPKMADPMLQGKFPMRGLYQALAVAAMCLQEQATTRPHIGDVVTALSYLASQTYDPNTPNRSNSSTPRARNMRNGDQRSTRSPNHHSPDLRRASKYGGGEVSRTSSTGGSGRRSGLDEMDMAGSPVGGSPAQTGRRRESRRSADRQRAIADAKMWGDNSRERNGRGSFYSTNE